jgi:hypothetical protein
MNLEKPVEEPEKIEPEEEEEDLSNSSKSQKCHLQLFIGDDDQSYLMKREGHFMKTDENNV